MKYTLACMWWEYRVLFSTLAAIVFFYHVRLIDSLLKHVLEVELTRKVELPVEIENLTLDLWNHKCEVDGIIVYHPTVAEDPRWHYEYLVHAKSIVFIFDPLQSLYAFCTHGPHSLLYVDEIVVKTVDLYVEGYEDIARDEKGQILSKKQILNLELVGGYDGDKKKRRKKKPTHAETTERDDAVSHLPATSTTALDTTASTPASTPASASASAVGVNNFSKSGSPLVAHLPTVPTSRQVYDSKEKKKSWSTSALSIGLKLGRKIHKLNKEVQKEGIVATVKTKTARVLDTVDSAYKSAKKKLGQSYHAKIQALHEKLRGGEPLPLRQDLFVQVKAITLLDMEITLRQALPPSLRQLEKSSLHVPLITLTELKRGWKPTTGPADPDSDLKPGNVRSDFSRNMNSDHSSDVTPGDSADKKADDARTATTHSPPITTATANDAHDSGKVTFASPACTVDCNKEDESKITADRKKEIFMTSDVNVTSSTKNTELISHRIASALMENVREWVRCLMEKAYFVQNYVYNKILVETYEGIPAVAVAYYFERILLHEMLKGNAGRVLQDAILGLVRLDDSFNDDSPQLLYDYDSMMWYDPSHDIAGGGGGDGSTTITTAVSVTAPASAPTAVAVGLTKDAAPFTRSMPPGSYDSDCVGDGVGSGGDCKEVPNVKYVDTKHPSSSHDSPDIGKHSAMLERGTGDDCGRDLSDSRSRGDGKSNNDCDSPPHLHPLFGVLTP